MSLHQERLQAEFKRALSEAMREIKDPRLSKMCSITNVELTKDLKHAKAYVSIYDEEDLRVQSVEVLNGASAMLMHSINGKMKMRRIPNIHFVLDDSIEYSVRISKLIDEIKAKEE